MPKRTSRVESHDRRAQDKHSQILTGRQIVVMIAFHFFQGAVLELTDLFNVELSCVNLRAFDNCWEETLLATDPDTNVLESLQYNPLENHLRSKGANTNIIMQKEVNPQKCFNMEEHGYNILGPED